MQSLRNLKFTAKVYWLVGKWRAVFIWVVYVLSGLDGILYGYIFKQILDTLVALYTGNSEPAGSLWLWVGAYAALLAFYNFTYFFRDYFANILLTKFSDYLDLMLVNKISELDVGIFEDSKFQDTLDKVKERSLGYFHTYLDQINSILMTLTAIISAFAVLIFNPILGLVALVLVIPTFYLQRDVSKFRLKSYETHRPQRRKRSYYYNILTELKAMGEIRTSNADTFFIPRFKSLQALFIDLKVKDERQSAKYSIPLTVLQTIGTVFVIFYLGGQIAAKLLTVGDFQFMWGRFNDARNSLRNLTRSLERIRDADDYVKDFYDLIKLQPKILRNKGIEITGNEITIEFENVSFKYPGSDKFVIKNASFKIADGEKIAFVGQNGAGKTTMIRLLCRFYDPTEGRILINGTDLKELNLNSWYERTGALFQDFNRYDLMVKENIGIADPAAIEDQGRIREASEKSGAAEFISELDGKYDQMIGKSYEKGTELSGGQWQKIALARAYMRNPEVLILDEPTAAIDAKAEAEIFRKLQDLGQDKTLILISHRFSTVRQVDKIFVIEHGEIVEQGSHAELMQIKDGKYAEMYTLQAQMYQ